MTPQKLIPVCLMVSMIFLNACNPDCETYSNITTVIEPQHRFVGEEILVKTVPESFLENRELYIRKSNSENFQMISSKYKQEVQGRILMLNEDIVDIGIQNIYIKDIDCGGYVPLNSVNVMGSDSSFYSSNRGLFITPTPPVIIIPPLSIPPPTPVINTWFSPDDPDFCIWFLPDTVRDMQTNCIREMEVLTPGTESGGTRELNCRPTNNPFSHGNLITGYINKKTGSVNITIDRSSKGFGSEGYTGKLVSVDSLIYLNQNYDWNGDRFFCNGPGANATDVKAMVLKSQKTGRQLVLYRHLPENILPLDSDICVE